MTEAGPRTGRQAPSLKGGLPFLGHVFEFRRDPVGLIQRGRDLHGNIFSFLLLGRRVHVLTGPAGNEVFFRAPDNVLSARDAYRFTVPIFGEGLVYDATPELMDRQFALVHPALRDDKMQSYARFVTAEVEDYLDRWGESGTVDLLEIMKEVTIRTAGRCLIGVEFKGDLSHTFAHLLHDLEGGINLVAFFAPNAPIPAMIRRDRARRQVVALLTPLIAARREAQGKTDDFLDILIAARDPDGRPLDEDTITGLLLALWFAGQHTSAVLATWSGLLLLQNPQHLGPVLDEQAAVLNNQAVTPAAVRRLARLERCIKEAERLHPPLVMLMRTVLQTFQFAGFDVPAGNLALVSAAVSHRIPQVFAHPEHYDPDRFAPPREEDRRQPFGLIGFGGGKHRCIGLAFAYQQVKVIWSVLLRRYDLELVSQEHRPNYTTFVVGPHQPCLVRYRRRSTALPESRMAVAG
jgi:sterol 14-demethylase